MSRAATTDERFGTETKALAFALKTMFREKTGDDLSDPKFGSPVDVGRIFYLPARNLLTNIPVARFSIEKQRGKVTARDELVHRSPVLWVRAPKTTFGTREVAVKYEMRKDGTYNLERAIRMAIDATNLLCDAHAAELAKEAERKRLKEEERAELRKAGVDLQAASLSVVKYPNGYWVHASRSSGGWTLPLEGVVELAAVLAKWRKR